MPLEMLSPPVVPPLPPIAPPAAPSPDDPDDKPQFVSPLRLTPVQLEKFRRETLERLRELRLEMGLSETNEVIEGSWMWLRKCNEAFFQGDLTPEFSKFFGKRLKVYAKAHLEKGIIMVDEVVSDQDW